MADVMGGDEDSETMERVETHCCSYMRCGVAREKQFPTQVT